MAPWLLSFIISMALKFGLAWVLKRFPDLQTKFPVLWAILEELVSKVKEAKGMHEDAKREAHLRIQKECFGVACPPYLSKEEEDHE